MWHPNYHFLALASLAAFGLSASPRDIAAPLSGDVSSFVDISAISMSSVSKASMVFGLAATDSPSTTTFIPGPGLGPGGNSPLSLPTTSQGANPAASIAAIATAAPSVGTTTVIPENKCWSTNDCKTAFGQFDRCYAQTGDIVQPNEHSNRSEVYQQCLCTGDYKTILVDQSANTMILNCIKCHKQAIPDMSTAQSPASQFLSKISDFCNTRDPNLFDLAKTLRNLMKAAIAPSGYDPALSRMTSAVDNLNDKFTSTPGMNVPTTSVLQLPTSGTLSWWESTMTQGDTIPTEYLAQVPPNWPYTEYGILAKAGKTTSFPFVNPNATAKTVAWLYHEVRWNPRPLYTPPAEKTKGLFQPLLEGWMHRFIYEVVTQTEVATPRVAIRTGTVGTTSMMASMTGSMGPVTVSGPDSSAARATSARASLRAPFAAEGSPASLETGQVLSEIWNDVQSIKSKLNG